MLEAYQNGNYNYGVSRQILQDKRTIISLIDNQLQDAAAFSFGEDFIEIDRRDANDTYFEDWGPANFSLESNITLF